MSVFGVFKKERSAIPLRAKIGIFKKKLTININNKLFWNQHYRSLREPKVNHGIAHSPKYLVAELEHLGIDVETFIVDIVDYELYLEKANYAKYRYIKPTAKMFPEKTLEHYIAAKLLNLQKADTFIDVASSTSPVPDIYSKLYNCTSYKQDLIYRNGLHGNVIGGDACQMPLPDGFANKMALHCSFEHFEQDADTKFIKEATRVLAENGKLCIIPLYLADQYSILTNPAVVPKGMKFEPEAILCCDRNFPERHGRFYDAAHFVSRIVANTNMKLTVYEIVNEKEVNADCYVRFVALFENNSQPKVANPNVDSNCCLPNNYKSQ